MRNFCFMAALCVFAAVLGGCAEGRRLPTTRREISEEMLRSKAWRDFDRVGVLSLDEAQRIAELNNPDYESTLYAVNAARMRYYAAAGAYAPEITGRFAVGQTVTDLDHIINPLVTTLPFSRLFSSDGSLNASWLLFDGLARELAVLARRSEFRASDADRENTRRVLRRSVAYAYFDVLLAEAMLAIANSDVTFRQSTFEQAGHRYNSGFIAKRDYLGFRVDLNNARVLVVNAACSRETARYALAALLGSPDGRLPDSMQLTPLADAVAMPDAGLETCFDEALARRPDLRGARDLVDFARYRKYAGISAFLPVIRFFGSVGFGTEAWKYRDYDQHHSYWNRFGYNYGVSMDWLIFNGFTRYNRYRELVALYEASRLDFLRREIEILAEVGSAYATYRAAVENARLYRETMDWVFEQRDLVNVEYWAGNVTITRLRGAQNDLVNAEGGLALSLIAAGKARAQLEAAVNGGVAYMPAADPKTLPLLDSLFDSLEKRFGEE
ncbi:MAG: TolC family protein [Victivallaceae bacterium]|nr:TolC family protein [Victivallaceae bacterium]